MVPAGTHPLGPRTPARLRPAVLDHPVDSGTGADHLVDAVDRAVRAPVEDDHHHDRQLDLLHRLREAGQAAGDHLLLVAGGHHDKQARRDRVEHDADPRDGPLTHHRPGAPRGAGPTSATSSSPSTSTTFNDRRLHGKLGHVAPVEDEDHHWATTTPEHYPDNPVPAGAGTNSPSLHETRGDSAATTPVSVGPHTLGS